MINMSRAENEITKFIIKEFKNNLEQNLLGVGFIPPTIEKTLPAVNIDWKRVKFDLWSKERSKKGNHAIWEIENKQTYADNNVKKIRGILNYSWKPKVFLFHIFSPLLPRTTESYSNEEAEKLKNKFQKRFVYKPIHINVPKNKFEQIKESFEKNKYNAKKRYGRIIEKETRRIAKECIEILKSR